MEAHIQRAAENEGQKSTTLTEQVGTKVPSTKCVLTKISWNFLGANFEKGTFLRLIHCVKEIRGHVAGFLNKGTFQKRFSGFFPFRGYPPPPP